MAELRNLNSNWPKLCFLYVGIFRIENWYPKLEPLTFKTVVFDLNYDEAQSLVKYRELQTLSLYKLQEEKKKTHSKASLVLDNETILKVKEEVCNRLFGTVWKWNFFHFDSGAAVYFSIQVMRSLTAKHKVALESLVSKLSSAIEPFASSAAKGAFVKTSSRSPKDAAFLTKAMKTILRERVLENIRKYPNATEQEAGDLDAIAFVQAATQSMRVTSGMSLPTIFLNFTETNIKPRYFSWASSRATFEQVCLPYSPQSREPTFTHIVSSHLLIVRGQETILRLAFFNLERKSLTWKWLCESGLISIQFGNSEHSYLEGS